MALQIYIGEKLFIIFKKAMKPNLKGIINLVPLLIKF